MPEENGELQREGAERISPASSHSAVSSVSSEHKNGQRTQPSLVGDKYSTLIPERKQKPRGRRVGSLRGGQESYGLSTKTHVKHPLGQIKTQDPVSKSQCTTLTEAPFYVVVPSKHTLGVPSMYSPAFASPHGGAFLPNHLQGAGVYADQPVALPGLSPGRTCSHRHTSL